MTIIIASPVSARMTLTDFDNEIVARGFDAFLQPTRYRYINWGYRRIARRARWLWELTVAQQALAVGDVGMGAWDEPVDVGHPVGNLKSIVKVYITSPSVDRAKLRHVSDDEFFDKWLPLDLTLAQNRSTPMGYYWWEDVLYILPPTDSPTTVQVHYKRQVSDLVNSTDVPITPPDLDEAIVTAALARCHKRANEISLSQQNIAELEEVFADMASDETFLEEEEIERVSPDDQWL
jgi:hypothetical protein